jgi:hypothetical protein
MLRCQRLCCFSYAVVIHSPAPHIHSVHRASAHDLLGPRCASSCVVTSCHNTADSIPLTGSTSGGHCQQLEEGCKCIDHQSVVTWCDMTGPAGGGWRLTGVSGDDGPAAVATMISQSSN